LKCRRGTALERKKAAFVGKKHKKDSLQERLWKEKKSKSRKKGGIKVLTCMVAGTRRIRGKEKARKE